MGRFSFSKNGELSIVGHLIIINTLCWLATIGLERYGIDVISLFGLHYIGSSEFGFWQFITYMFLHDTSSIAHLFCNMFALFMFGRIFEQVWGGKKFILYYLFTGLGAGIIQQLTWAIDMNSMVSAFDAAAAQGSASGYESIISSYFKVGNWSALNSDVLMSMKDEVLSHLITVGASGAVFGLLLAFGWLFPNEEIFIFLIPIPIKARYFVIGYAVIELIGGVSGFSFDNVAHFAHLGGMLFGLIPLLYWKKKGLNYSQRMW